MQNSWQWRWLIVGAGAPVVAAQAAPIEGALFSSIAALLLVLGMGSLLLGVRNLRRMRHRRISPVSKARRGYRQSKSGS